MQVVFILSIIFICIAYPILVFIYVWSMPVYVIIAYFIWVFVTIGWICLSERPKISEYVIPVLFFLTVFTLIWASGFGDTYLIEESDEWFWMYVAPALNVPAFCFIGNWENLESVANGTDYSYGSKNSIIIINTR